MTVPLLWGQINIYSRIDSDTQAVPESNRKHCLLDLNQGDGKGIIRRVRTYQSCHRGGFRGMFILVYTKDATRLIT